MKLIIIFLTLLITTPALAVDVWTNKDTTYQAAFILLTGIDWAQTKEIARNKNYYETNPILGKNPSQNEVDLFILSGVLVHTGIAYYLPKKYRRIWQCIWIGIETHCIYHNHSAGIRINF